VSDLSTVRAVVILQHDRETGPTLVYSQAPAPFRGAPLQSPPRAACPWVKAEDDGE